MGRGAQAQTQQLIDQQLAQTNAMKPAASRRLCALGLRASAGLSEFARQSWLFPSPTIGHHEFCRNQRLSSSSDGMPAEYVHPSGAHE